MANFKIMSEFVEGFETIGKIGTVFQFLVLLEQLKIGSYYHLAEEIILN